MRFSRLTAGPGTVAEIRALVPAAANVTAAVTAIIADVAARGDAAVNEYTERFDESPAPPLRVADGELAEALDSLDPLVRGGLEVAIANVAAVGWGAAREPREMTLTQGHSIVVREIPVTRAAVYVPGGAAPYPSTVVMGVVTARAAGVEEVVVCTPPPTDPVVLAACALAGVEEVYRIGGAQAVAALAYGTDTVAPVDVIVGPGNLYVQEAKRLVSDRVGIDSFAGPSDLFVLFDAADAGSIRLIALDLLAQAEHGAATLVIAAAPDPALLDQLRADIDALEKAQGSSGDATCVLLDTGSLAQALELANAYAPEHLELIGPSAEELAAGVRNAGCLFIGWPSATAFGDYVAGSNHILPTAGSARFASGLTPAHFRRQMAEVRINPAALPALIEAGGPIADAEGFHLHAESMRARVPPIEDNERR
ncbi:MAG TPA: histidinol dehydrogenase [Solirubrobacteraceae bacterium]|nr:histidinol dehydrogenase [Solirubrobacteraceae bacterium]